MLPQRRLRCSRAGLQHLTLLPELQELNLNGTSISDRGIDSLLKLSSLRRVALENARVTASGASYLKQRSPELKLDLVFPWVWGERWSYYEVPNGPETSAPSSNPISRLQEYPSRFTGEFQAFVKNGHQRSEYGSMEFIESHDQRRVVTVALMPSCRVPPMGYQDKGFDPRHGIRQVGLKISAQSDRVRGTGYRPFRGTIRVAKVRSTDMDRDAHPEPEMRPPAEHQRQPLLVRTPGEFLAASGVDRPWPIGYGFSGPVTTAHLQELERSYNGKILWSVAGGGKSTPVVVQEHGGDFLINLSDSRKNGLSAYRLTPTGPQKLWTLPVFDRASSPVAFDGHVYAIAGGSNGHEAHILCVHLDTGKVAWDEVIDFAEVSSPVVADGKVFAVCGTFLWLVQATAQRYSVLSQADCRITLCTSPALFAGWLYLRQANAVSCYDLRSAP